MIKINPRIMTLGRYHVLSDAEVAADLTEELFQPGKLEEMGLISAQAQGRGEAWFISYRGRDWVLRHFRRGGLIGRFINDHYLGWNLERTRAWAEWRLLAELCSRGLPVPRPVAAAVTRGLGLYRADLLTELIPDSQSLADLLTKDLQDENFWREVGACLRRFHDQGVYHADLNARNILINGNLKIFLIDFDRGSLRISGVWTQNNLQRLKRSLFKIKGASDNFHFDETEWKLLLDGYNQRC